MWILSRAGIQTHDLLIMSLPSKPAKLQTGPLFNFWSMWKKKKAYHIEIELL